MPVHLCHSSWYHRIVPQKHLYYATLDCCALQACSSSLDKSICTTLRLTATHCRRAHPPWTKASVLRYAWLLRIAGVLILPGGRELCSGCPEGSRMPQRPGRRRQPCAASWHTAYVPGAWSCTLGWRMDREGSMHHAGMNGAVLFHDQDQALGRLRWGFVAWYDTMGEYLHLCFNQNARRRRACWARRGAARRCQQRRMGTPERKPAGSCCWPLSLRLAARCFAARPARLWQAVLSIKWVAVNVLSFGSARDTGFLEVSLIWVPASHMTVALLFSKQAVRVNWPLPKMLTTCKQMMCPRGVIRMHLPNRVSRLLPASIMHRTDAAAPSPPLMDLRSRRCWKRPCRMRVWGQRPSQALACTAPPRPWATPLVGTQHIAMWWVSMPGLRTCEGPASQLALPASPAQDTAGQGTGKGSSLKCRGKGRRQGQKEGEGRDGAR